MSTTHLQNDEELQPGIYRIISAVAGTAIQVSNRDHTKAITWEQHGGDTQQWFLQNAGDGYQFRNRRYGSYLAVSNTDVHSLVYASRYPTTWVLLKSNDSHLIQFPDNVLVFALHYGLATNGNEIHLWPPDGSSDKNWKLERLGDDTGKTLPGSYQGEDTRLQHDLSTKIELLSLMDQKIDQQEKECARIKGDLLEKTEALASTRNELVKKEDELSQCQDIIRQLQRELRMGNETHSHVRGVNTGSGCLCDQQAQLRVELSQQKSEITELRAKMERLEKYMNKTTHEGETLPYDNNMT